MLGATLFSAMFCRDAAPISERVTRTYRLGGIEHALTAFEAYDAVERLVRDVDIDYLLASIESDSDVDQRGRALQWLIRFHLPVRRGVAEYRVARHDSVAEEDGMCDGRCVIVIEERVAPRSVDRADSAAGVPEWKRGVLPVPFKDSWEIVRALPMRAEAAGATKAAGARLASAFDEGGSPVWRLTVAGETRTLPLAA
jgi:hypothetical protein